MTENVSVKFWGAALLTLQGYKVFPLHDVSEGHCSCDKGADCKEGGKHPRISAWQSNASKSKSKIEYWWQKWPEANIGVPTGEANGLFVIDVDDDEGQSKLEKLLGGLPTATAFSARGMPHYWFRFPKGANITNRRGGIPIGVDVRGNGGFIIAPPSVSYKGAYTGSMETIKLVEPSETLLKLLEPTIEETLLVNTSQVKKYSNLSSSKQRRYEAYWSAAYEDNINQVEQLSADHEWNATLYKAAARLFELVKAPWIPEDDFEAVKQDLIKACEPNYDNEGWDEERCLRTINSALSNIMHKDGVLSEPASDQPKGKEWPEGKRQRGKPRLVFFSEVKAQPIEWYEEPWLPVSGLTGLAGPEDTGKSTYFIYEIAKLTTGGFGRPPIKVLYFAKEDDEAMTKARLKLAGADLAKVAFLRIDVPLDNESTYERDLNLKEDLEMLREAIHGDPEIRAIYLDPANSYLGIDEDKDGYSDIRVALERLNQFAKQEKVLIRAMKHTKKPSGQILPMVSMVYGTKAWTEVIRVFPILWPVDEKLREKLNLDIDDMTNVVLLRGKNNYAPKSLPAKGMCIDSRSVKMDGHTYDNVTYMSFTKEQDVTNDEIQDKLAETKQETKERRGEENETDIWLEMFLKERGKVRRKEVIAAYLKAGIATDRTLKSRANRMGIIKEAIPGTNNEVFWSLDPDKLTM